MIYDDYQNIVIVHIKLSLYPFLCQVSHFKEYIPKAFPYGKDLILDAEVLMMDTKSGNPLPFGTLGVHKVSVIFSVVFFRMCRKPGI